MAQINPEWFNAMSNHNPETRRIVDDVDKAIDDQAIDMSTTLRTIGREAIKKIRGLMYEDNPHIALKAAVDLADRSAEVSKVHKHEITGQMQVRSDDAKMLAEALVRAAEARQRFAESVKDGFSRVEVEIEHAPIPSHILANPESRSDPQADAQAAGEADAKVDDSGAGQPAREVSAS